jgi:hypothetical protein
MFHGNAPIHDYSANWPFKPPPAANTRPAAVELSAPAGFNGIAAEQKIEFRIDA